MRKVALLLMSFTLFLLPSLSFAAENTSATQSPYIGITNQDQVDMHRGATTDYKVVASIPKNYEVIAIDKFTNNLNENWLRVIYNDTAGWVKADTISNSEFIASTMYAIKSANVRRGATNNYSIIASISKSQKVSVIDRFVNSDNEVWYRVDLPSGIKGWVLSSYLTKEPILDSSAINQEIYIKEDNTTIHRGALSSYKVVATLAKDNKVTVIDEFTNNLGELWYRVEVNANLSGWVLASNTTTSMEKPYVVSVDAANVRSAATSTSDKVTTILNGTHVIVTDQFTNAINELWFKVKLDDGTVGWILSSLLSPASSDISVQGIIGTKNAQLRRGADYGYKVTANIPYQTSVTKLSEFYNSKNEKWFNIELSDGKKGWVPSYEVYNSLNDRTYVYSKVTFLRRGAGTGYAVNSNIKVGEPLLSLRNYNNWINVETSSGNRGWIQATDVSSSSSNLLFSPVIKKQANNTTLITWKKSNKFSLKYTIQSDKTIKITGSNILTNLPSGTITGLNSITSTQGSISLKTSSGYSSTIRDYDDSFTIKISPASLVGKKIIIDAGHGGTDTGAIGPTGLREKDVTLPTAQLLKQELEKQGAIVTLTRNSDVYITLDNRTVISNTSEYDAFISIHANSSTSASAHGTETYYDVTKNFNASKSSVLAKYVQTSLVSQIKTTDRGEKTSDYYVLRNNDLPSILVELAFISNPTEEMLLKDVNKRALIVKGIAGGISNYFKAGN